MLYCGFKEPLTRFRLTAGLPPINQDPFHLDNIPSDCVLLMAHGVVSFVAIFLIEGIVNQPIW